MSHPLCFPHLFASNSLCLLITIQLLVYPTFYMFHSVCIALCEHLTPCVTRFICVPFHLCPTSCVWPALYVLLRICPAYLSLTLCMSPLCTCLIPHVDVPEFYFGLRCGRVAKVTGIAKMTVVGISLVTSQIPILSITIYETQRNFLPHTNYLFSILSITSFQAENSSKAAQVNNIQVQANSY